MVIRQRSCFDHAENVKKYIYIYILHMKQRIPREKFQNMDRKYGKIHTFEENI